MSVSNNLKDALLPWRTVTPDDLGTYAQAIGSMFSQVEVFAEDQDDGTPGWATMFNPATCPLVGLPYLAQFVGERVATGMTEAQMRALITAQPNHSRGTIAAMVRKAQLRLTGAKTVLVHPRFRMDGTSDPDYVTVETLALETPSPTLTQEDILSVMPADIVLNYAAESGATWADIASAFATWTLVSGSEPDWSAVANAVGLGGAGWLVFTA